MDWIIPTIAGIISATAASMGLGGGSILLIILISFLQIEQLNAQGINLLFFIAVAIISLIIHSRHGYVKWKVALFAAGGGVLGAGIGAFIATAISPDILRYIFAALLILGGLRGLFSKPKPCDNSEESKPPKQNHKNSK